MEGFVMEFASNAVRVGGAESSELGFWTRLPESLHINDIQNPVFRYGVVAAGVTVVGVSVAVATKKVKDRKLAQQTKTTPSLPRASTQPKNVNIPKVTPVPIFSENIKVDNETKIHYELYGRGPQKIILLGGMGARLSLLEGFIAELITHPEYQICAYDHRNSGFSTGPKQKLSSKLLAEDTVKLVEHLGWKKVHVFGFSMGGCVAMEYALMAPERVASLYLSATTAGRKYVRIPFGPKFYSLVFGGFVSMQKEKLVDILLSQHHSEEYLDSLALEDDGNGGTALSSRTVRDVLRTYFLENWERLVSFNDDTVASQGSVVSTHYLSDEQLKRLGNFGFPVVIQYNTKDPMDAGGAAAKRLCGNLSSENCTVLAIEGAGHFGIREDWTRFMASFLANCTKSTAFSS